MLYIGFLAIGNICVGMTAYLMQILNMKEEIESLFDFCNILRLRVKRGCMCQPCHLSIILNKTI